MKKWLTALLIFLCGSSLVFADMSVIQNVDALYGSRHINGNIQKSLYQLETAMKNVSDSETNYQLLWRYARSASQVPDYLEGKKSKKLKFLKQGQLYADQANALFPERIEAIYWQAICKGRHAELKGILRSLKSIKPIRKSMETILAKDPNFHRAYFVLSRLYRKAPKFISIGNPKKSETFINKALELDPTESLYLLEKARVLYKLKKKKEAKKVIQTLLTLSMNPRYFQDQVARDQRSAKELLETL